MFKGDKSPNANSMSYGNSLVNKFIGEAYGVVLSVYEQLTAIVEFNVGYTQAELGDLIVLPSINGYVGLEVKIPYYVVGGQYTISIEDPSGKFTHTEAQHELKATFTEVGTYTVTVIATGVVTPTSVFTKPITVHIHAN